ncbi:MAG TPA: phosphatase PAP2 family protein [Gemmatimonadales bacterium]|nr:phosphatase PAP2 family protein [Gemmatimonadales bacterium]
MLLERFKVRYARVWTFITARFARGEYLGLHLTIGFLISGVGLWILLGVTEDVIHHDPITQFDLTLLNWLQAHRGAAGDQVFRAISALGSPLVMIILALGVAVSLGIRRQGLLLQGWVTAFLGGSLLNTVLKHAIHRPRPLTVPMGVYHSWSFPSGHAMGSLIGYGMLAYVLVLLGPSPRSPGARVAIIGAAAILVLAIGVSRLYLGAHYFSDVVGGYGAGMLWLSACISGLEVTRRWRAA